MGVKGLWRILEAVRRKADLEQLRGKRIAIDMNIWLHQALKSKAKGGTNMHLVILFRRICKLLFYGIRPIFVFDGAVPALKRKTMADRRAIRNRTQERSIRARNNLLKRLFRRLAENSVNSKKSNKELTTEILNRYNSTEAMRKAEMDEEIFGSQNSSLEAPLPSSSILHLESEQEVAMRLAQDFVANSSSIDIHSDAFNALPMQAQLQVILILQDTSLQLSPRVSGETFSQAQVQRLVMRRELSRKKGEIETRMNESLMAKVVPKTLQAAPDMEVKALRIASQDEGHAILLKKRSTKEKSDDLKERLNRIFSGVPKLELNENQVPGSNLVETLASNSMEHSSNLKINPESSDHSDVFETDNEIDVKYEIQTSESSSDTDGFVDVEENSDEIKSLDTLALRLIQSQECETSSSFNENPVCIPEPLIAKEYKDEESSAEESSDDGDFDDTTDQSVSTENTTDIRSSMEYSTSTENTPDLENGVQVSNTKTNNNAKSCIKELDEKKVSEKRVSDSESNTEMNQNKALPKISSFLASELDQMDEVDLGIDDDALRAEADRFERLAQETTSDCVAEAQRLIELFGFPIITSPEEAEAQCCRLQQLGLVDVVASDDSDVWIFGANLVCRHLFGSESGKGKSKPTSLYSSENIKSCLGLDRHQLIQLALLCGSDYTKGIDKVGPVKALEIVAFFSRSYQYPESTEVNRVLQPLVKFREFCQKGLDARWKNIKIPDDFPNERVIEGYLSPEVKEPSEFHWDTPQMALLIQFNFLNIFGNTYAVEKLGWSRHTSEGTLNNVLSKFNATSEVGALSRTPQITEFFPRVETVLKGSCRLAQAVDKLKCAKEFENLPDLDDDWSTDDKDQKVITKSSKKRRSTNEAGACVKKRGKSK